MDACRGGCVLSRDGTLLPRHCDAEAARQGADWFTTAGYLLYWAWFGVRRVFEDFRADKDMMGQYGADIMVPQQA